MPLFDSPPRVRDDPRPLLWVSATRPAAPVLLCVFLAAAGAAVAWRQLVAEVQFHRGPGPAATGAGLAAVGLGALLGWVWLRRVLRRWSGPPRAAGGAADEFVANFVGAAILLLGLAWLAAVAGGWGLESLRGLLAHGFQWPIAAHRLVLGSAALALHGLTGLLLAVGLLVAHGWYRSVTAVRDPALPLWWALTLGVSAGGLTAALVSADGALLFTLLTTFLAGGLAVVQPQLGRQRGARERLWDAPDERRAGDESTGMAVQVTAGGLGFAVAGAQATGGGAFDMSDPRALAWGGLVCAVVILLTRLVARRSQPNAAREAASGGGLGVASVLFCAAVWLVAAPADGWRWLGLAALAAGTLSWVLAGRPTQPRLPSLLTSVGIAAGIGLLAGGGLAALSGLEPGALQLRFSLLLSGFSAVAFLLEPQRVPAARIAGVALVCAWLAISPRFARPGVALPSPEEVAASAEWDRASDLRRVAADLFDLAAADSALLSEAEFTRPGGRALDFDLAGAAIRQLGILAAPLDGFAGAGAADPERTLRRAAARVARRLTGQARVVLAPGVSAETRGTLRSVLRQGHPERREHRVRLEDAAEQLEFVVYGADVPFWLARAALPEGVKLTVSAGD